MKSTCIGFAFAVLALVALPAGADTFDGTEPFVCAHLESVECTSNRQCAHGSAHHVRIPSLVTVDVKRKKIVVLDEDRRGETTEIKSVTRGDGQLILQGSEGERGWTLLVRRDTGETVLTVSDGQAGFIVFGECATP